MNAFDGMIGAPRALGGAVGGQARDQEVWTPDWVLDAARETLGGTIQLDPCGASSYEAREVRRPDGRLYRRAITAGWYATVTLALDGGDARTGPHGGLVLPVDGLSCSWVGYRTFVNPPYNTLETWLTKCAGEAQSGATVIALIPVRTRRPWWVTLCRTGQIVFLHYDVRFKGYLSAHPENMALVSWNCTIPDLGAKETGRW